MTKGRIAAAWLPALAACAALFPAAPAAAQKPGAEAAPREPVRAPARAPSAARTAMLDRLAGVLVLRGPLESMAIGATGPAYRNVLDRSRDLDRMEATAPGLRDAMVAAASAHARDAAPRLVAELAEEVRAYWDPRLSDEDLAALVAYLDQPFFTRYARMNVDVRPGEDIMQAYRRNAAALERSQPDTKEAQRRRLAFEQSPAGRRLLPHFRAYQRAIGQRQIRATNLLAGEAMRAAQAAAEAHIARAAQIRNSI